MKQLSILIAVITFTCASIASANETFWKQVAAKQYKEALETLKHDKTVEINWVSAPGALKAVSMAAVPGKEHKALVAAIWVKKNGRPSLFTSAQMQALFEPGMEAKAKAMFKDGFESDETGMRFLHWLCYKGRLDLITFYVERLVDKTLLNTAVDVVDDAILHSAIFGEVDVSKGQKATHREIVKYLVGQGANVNARGEYGRTLLILAAEFGMTRMVRTLVGLGADVHAQDDLGETALLRAARNGHERVVAFLLGRQANPNVAAIAGDLPLAQAAANGYENVVALLRENIEANAADEEPAPKKVAAKAKKSKGKKRDAGVLVEGEAPQVQDDAQKRAQLEPVAEEMDVAEDGAVERNLFIELRLAHAQDMDHGEIERVTHALEELAGVQFLVALKGAGVNWM